MSAPIVDRRLIKAGCCSHFDHKGRVVWDPYIAGLPKEERREWVRVKLDLGLTHIMVSREWTYDKYVEHLRRDGGSIPGGSMGNAEFVGMLEDLLSWGICPLVWLPFADDFAGSQSVYDGRMEADLQAIRHLASQLGPVSLSFENVSVWRTKAICDGGTLFRQVMGEEGLLALHGRDNERCTAASFHGDAKVGDPVPTGLMLKPYPGQDFGALIEDDDPSDGDEPGFWFAPGADEYDYFFWQSRHGGDGPAFTNGDDNPDSGTWSGRCVECFERFAAPGTFMPALNRQVREIDPRVGRSAPDWMNRSRKRGRVVFVPLELPWVEASRGQLRNRLQTRSGEIARYCRDRGMTHYGSGLPEWN